ncbi:MAG: cbb3-type cytochrome c oxidase subunit I, partial [bacterium]
MTTLDSRPVATEVKDNYLTFTRGLLSWIFTLDHKRIGVMYLFAVLGSFFVGGVMALLVRTKLLFPGKVEWMTADEYNKAFTLHGAIMVFLVIIPSIPAALGNFVLPIMLGAKDVAFPRLNLFSFYLWLAGAACAVYSLMAGGFDTGWTFYTPYSSQYSAGGTIPVLVGVFILGFSSIFTGVNFVVTIHKLRPP